MNALVAGDYVDFLDYPHQRDFGKRFTLGWFNFVALSDPGSMPVVHNSLPTPPRLQGLAIPKTGVKIEIRTGANSATVEVNTGGSRDVEVIALDSQGVASVQKVPRDRPSRSVTMTGQ